MLKKDKSMMDPPEDEANGSPTETSPLMISKPAPEGPLAGASSHGTFESNHKSTDPEDPTPEHQPATTDQSPEDQYPGLPSVRKQLPVIFPAIAIGVFLAAADQTIVVSSYGIIGSELKALDRTSWIATAYFLTLTSCQPLYGKLSDIFGRKSCLLFGYAVFGLGCLGCGLARGIEELIAARAFAGIGGGAMTTVVSILLSDVVTIRERGKWQGYINIIFAAGASAGAPLGGFAADVIGWRWAFLVQVPMCAIAFIAVTFVLKLPANGSDKEAWRARLRRIDFMGALVLIAAVFALLLALDRGSNVSWTAPITYISLAVSIPLFALFILVEIKFAVEPFAPGHIIFNRAMAPYYLCNFFSMAGQMAAIFYIPLEFQVVGHASPTRAGLQMIPGVILGVSGSLFAGLYMQRTGKYYWLTVIAYAGLTAGMIVIFLCSGVVVSSTIGIILGMCITGFANGNGITTTLIGIIANASREDQAVATACSYLFRSLGNVCGVSMSATVANQALRKGLTSELPALGLPENEALDIADRVRQSLQVLKRLDPGVRAVVERCFARSTSAAFGLQIALVLGAAVSAWFIRERTLSR